MHERGLGGERGAVVLRLQPREVLDELIVVLAQGRQVPGLVDHPRGLAQRAQLGPEGQQLRGLLGLTSASRSTCGVIHSPLPSEPNPAHASCVVSR